MRCGLVTRQHIDSCVSRVSDRTGYRSGYGILPREIKYTQLTVGAKTRVEIEHQKRQNSKHHPKQCQRRAIGVIFCERVAEQNSRNHEGGIANAISYLPDTTSDRIICANY